MKKYFIFFFSIKIILLLFFFSCSAKTIYNKNYIGNEKKVYLNNDTSIVAQIGGNAITNAEFYSELIDFSKANSIQNIDSKTMNNLLDAYTLTKAIVEIARLRQLDKSDTYLELSKRFQEKLLADMIENDLLNNIGIPSDLEVNDYYLKNKNTFLLPKRIALKNILSDSSAILESLLAKAKKNIIFNEIISDTSLKIKVSDLGLIEKDMLEADLDSAAFALKQNMLSNVIKSKLGYHILFCYNIQDDRIIPFNENLKNDIRQFLIKKKMKEKIDALVLEFKKNNKYKLFYENIKRRY